MGRRDNTLHGELYLDKDGNAHFICHTPGDVTFEETRTAYGKFIDVLQDQLKRQKKCPFHEKH